MLLTTETLLEPQSTHLDRESKNLKKRHGRSYNCPSITITTLRSYPRALKDVYSTNETVRRTLVCRLAGRNRQQARSKENQDQGSIKCASAARRQILNLCRHNFWLII